MGKVYVASGILCVIIGVFFQVIKPGQEWDNNMVHDDDEFYYDYVENDEDTDDFWQNNDVSANKWNYMYQNKTRLWTLSILITYLIVLVVTLIVSIWMERFNSLADMSMEIKLPVRRTLPQDLHLVMEKMMVQLMEQLTC